MRLVAGLSLVGLCSAHPLYWMKFEEGFTKVVYGPKQYSQAIIRHAPFEFQFQRDRKTHIRFNSRGLLNMEHWTAKDGLLETEDSNQASAQGEDGNMWWDESSGGNTDSKLKGPASVGLEI